MKRPTNMDALDALYIIAAKDGRGDALFGNTMEIARPALQRTLIGNSYPSLYLEFPLLGKPCFDFLTIYGDVESGAQFAPDAGYGYQAMIDWFRGIKPLNRVVSCGLELDTSSGETERAGVYLQQRHRHELVEPFLKSVGEVQRAQEYLKALERMPQGWPPSYVGLFPGRDGTPLRIGGYMDNSEHDLCTRDAEHLGASFKQIGFSAFNTDMLERCTKFMELAPSVDFQFDIMQDGSLGNTFGLSLSFNETRPREAHDCMDTGYGAKLLQLLQDWGLADDRWKLIADAAFSRYVPFEREDGSIGSFYLCIRFNYAKIKFVSGEPQPAKFYLSCSAGELKDL